jgi:hypothetical protein
MHAAATTQHRIPNAEAAPRKQWSSGSRQHNHLAASLLDQERDRVALVQQAQLAVFVLREEETARGAVVRECGQSRDETGKDKRREQQR